jgi:hypothetical protein
MKNHLAWGERGDDPPRSGKVARYGTRWADLLLLAIVGSVVRGYIKLHNDDVQAPLAVLLLASFPFGFARPKRAWVWALIIGLGVPLSSLLSLKIGVFYPCRPGHRYSCEGAGSVANALRTFLLLLPALASAYAGATARRVAGRRQTA